MRFKNFVSRNILGICLLAFVIAFIISRIPYFLIPIAGFGGDLPCYYNFTYQIFQGKAPVFYIDPPGFPLFLYFCEFIVTKSSQILLIQNILSILSYSLLIFAVFKYYRRFVIPVTIASIIIIFNCSNLDYDTLLQTESIFVNSLLVLISLTLICINNPNQTKYWILLSVCFILPILIRMNGIIILGLFFFLLLYMLLNKFKKNIFYKLIFPFLTLCIIWSFYNYKTQHIFFIGYPKVILGGFNSLLIHNKNMTGAEIKKENDIRTNHPLHKYFNIPDSADYATKSDHYNDTRVDYGFKKNNFDNFIDFYKNAASKDNNWYSIMKRRYKAMYVGKWSQSHDPFFGFQDESYNAFVFKEYIDPPSGNIETFAKIKKNIPFKIYDYSYNTFYKTFFRNYFWLFFNIIIYLLTLFWFIKSKFKDKEAFILLFIILLNVLNSVIFLTSAVPLYRYSYTTEFTYYIVPSLFLFISPIRYFIISKTKMFFRKIY